MNRGNFGTFAESFMGSLGKNVLLGQQMEEMKKKRKIQELLTSGNPEDIQKAYQISGDPKAGLEYQKLIKTESIDKDLQRVLSDPNLTDEQKRKAVIDFSARTGDYKTWYEQTKPRINLKELGEIFNTKDGKTKSSISIDESGQFKGGTLSEKDEKELNLPPDIDTFGMLKLGRRYSTPEGRTEIMEYLGTPAGKVEYEKWWDKRKTTAPPIYNIVPGYQTPTGQPATIEGRTGVITEPKSPQLQKTPSEGDVTFTRNYTSTMALLDGLESKFKTIEKKMAETWGERLYKTPLLKTESFLQSDPDVATIKAFTEATLAKLIRSLGEVGTLTDRDIQRARDAMPLITDTIDVKNQKLTQLRDLTTEIFERGQRQIGVVGLPKQNSRQTSGGSLTPAEKDELEQLRKKYGR